MPQNTVNPGQQARSEVPTGPAGPDRWQWRARYVQPGTPPADEPTQHLPVGWWITGITGTDVPADERCGGIAAIRVHYAVADDGEDITAEISHRIAAALGGAGSPGNT
ncbi:hypothetical protein [Saccharopolyspora cebuensis]|uniref:hypothetical protein n=1 Tax=Saccharopolyspora cebuensis TaxID=418759 RepID=UPI0031EF37E3